MFRHSSKYTVWLVFNLLQSVIVDKVVEDRTLAILIMSAILVFSVLILEKVQNAH